MMDLTGQSIANYRLIAPLDDDGRVARYRTTDPLTGQALVLALLPDDTDPAVPDLGRARPEDAPDLGEGRGGVGDRAEDEGTDDRVDTGIGKRDSLRCPFEEGQRSPQFDGALREIAAHGGARLDGGQGDVAREIGEVRARSRPNLHDRAAEVGEERPLVPPVIGVVHTLQALHQPGGEWAQGTQGASGNSGTRR